MGEIFTNAHPFLFTLNSLLAVYTEAKWEASPIEILRPLLVLWLLLLALYPFARKIAGRHSWAGILLTVFVSGFFFDRKYFVTVSIIVIVVVLIQTLYLVLSSRQFKISTLSLGFTYVSLVLLVVQTTGLVVSLASVPLSYYEAMSARAAMPAVPLHGPDSRENPDIYYIVLDSYASPATLREFYEYDNSAFVGYLKDLGFVVPDAAVSNYSRTALSVSSTLDMQYWNTISPNMEEVAYWWPTKPVLDHSRVRASLEAVGYRSIAIASDWELTNNGTTNLYFKPFPVVLTEYEDLLIRSTPLKILHQPFQAIAPVRTNDIHRRFVLYSMETLARIPGIPGPKFVFAHIIMPHPPFVFRADGRPIETNKPFTFGSPADLSREEYRQSYLAQLEYVNTQLSGVIRAILDKSATSPIILIQADHGLGLSSDKECLNDRFSAFGAYYLPGKSTSVIPDDLTPVNLFRLVFNEYFGADLDLLENHQYFADGHGLFIGLEDVTEQIKEVCGIPRK